MWLEQARAAKPQNSEAPVPSDWHSNAKTIESIYAQWCSLDINRIISDVNTEIFQQKLSRVYAVFIRTEGNLIKRVNFEIGGSRSVLAALQQSGQKSTDLSFWGLACAIYSLDREPDFPDRISQFSKTDEFVVQMNEDGVFADGSFLGDVESLKTPQALKEEINVRLIERFNSQV